MNYTGCVKLLQTGTATANYFLTGNKKEAITDTINIPPTTAKDMGEEMCIKGPKSILTPINASITANP